MLNTSSYLVFRGLTLERLDQNFCDWFDLYLGELLDDLIFRILESDSGMLLIEVDERLKTEFFFFLVNFMGLLDEQNQTTYTLQGFTTGNDNDFYAYPFLSPK